MEQLWANWTILSTTQSQIQSTLNHKAHHINHSEFLNVCPFAIWPISLELIHSFLSYFIPILLPFHKHPTFYKIYPKLFWRLHFICASLIRFDEIISSRGQSISCWQLKIQICWIDRTWIGYCTSDDFHNLITPFSFINTCFPSIFKLDNCMNVHVPPTSHHRHHPRWRTFFKPVFFLARE